MYFIYIFKQTNINYIFQYFNFYLVIFYIFWLIHLLKTINNYFTFSNKFLQSVVFYYFATCTKIIERKQKTAAMTIEEMHSTHYKQLSRTEPQSLFWYFFPTFNVPLCLLHIHNMWRHVIIYHINWCTWIRLRVSKRMRKQIGRDLINWFCIENIMPWCKKRKEN